MNVEWLDGPDEKAYAAARSYLSLLVPPGALPALIGSLPRAPLGTWRAKDILRAARLPLLGKHESPEVTESTVNIEEGKPLSPILLVVFSNEAVLHIADGYHRACAVAHVHEDTLVPGRLYFSS
ncbi:MAG: hypothetical protein ABSG64_09755 [Solirubrobacteraceae bacterium]|jgi:hypothetical protein